ncbi:glycosyl transferase [Barnesiella viscericola DSM 18177]|uniref:Glycosyl transferase n=1 Tax=Barnesiella viscericola DSM 18177 TaxID=880074 RepID=W0ELA0_9BACT|nr:glycosyltransferase family 2 protein [Barnesiella viscericola]AHF11567.1 glycosyl transferase [Barnesiella viscericola DSM 18177]
MISIVIPLYNKEKQIAYTLQSVLNQTFQDFEVVIVDDGSTDGSVAEVEKFEDQRFRVVHQQNAGVSAARNRGIDEATGELIAFLDADDEWKPEYLATQNHLYQKYPDCRVYACNYEFRDLDGKMMQTIIHKLPFTSEDGILSNYFEVASCSHPPLWTSAVMVKKQAIQAIGGFPVGIRSGEDLLTWARLVVRGQIAYSKRVQAVYRQGYSNPRLPEEQDFVGEQLEKLFRESPSTRGLKDYVAFWYKMRMCRCLAHRMWGKAGKAFIKSLRYNLLQGKIYMSVVKYTLIGLK